MGTLELTSKELQALVLLASHAGKIILVYAYLQNIPESRSETIQRHRRFQHKEYQKLLNFYNALARKCELLLQKQTRLQLQDVLGE